MNILQEAYTINVLRIFKHPSLIFSKFFWWDIKYKISAYFNPRQKWLTSTIPKTWCDKVALIPHLLFTCLVHFVEKEKGLREDYDYAEDLEKGYVTQQYVDSIIATDTELREAYNYIKIERPELVKQLENSYPTPKEPTTEFFTKSDDGHYTMKSCEELYGLSFKEAYAEHDRLTKLLEEKDMHAMNTIVKHYQIMWT